MAIYTKELLNLELQTYAVMLLLSPVTEDVAVVLGIHIPDKLLLPFSVLFSDHRASCFSFLLPM